MTERPKAIIRWGNVAYWCGFCTAHTFPHYMNDGFLVCAPCRNTYDSCPDEAVPGGVDERARIKVRRGRSATPIIPKAE